MDAHYDLPLRKDEKARSYLNEGALKCETDDTRFVLTFDHQKALPFTILSFSEANYKRNMYVYNLGIHNVGNVIRTMYMWAECISSRGSQEIVSMSCLIRHIKTFASDKIVIILYSDSCTSQS